MNTVTDKNNKIVLSFLTISVVLCFGVIALQNAKLSSLQHSLDDQIIVLASIQQGIDDQARAFLVQTDRVKIAQIRSLDSGVYQLAVDIPSDPLGEKMDAYTIHNIVLDIKVGAMKQKLQFGYASAGLTTHVLYIDSDSDGEIDTEMLDKFIDSIPGVSLFKRFLVDADHSQKVYDEFRSNIDRAEQLSTEDVSDYADAEIGRFWNWLNEKSEEMVELLEETLDEN